MDPNSTEEEITWVGDKDDEVLVVAEDPEPTVSEVRGTMLRVAGGGATTDEVPWNPEPALEFSYSTPSVTLPLIGVPVVGDVTASITPGGMTADFSIAPGYSPSGQVSALLAAETTFGMPSNAPSASLDLRGGSGQLGGGVAVSTDFANYTSIKGMVGFGAGGRVKVNHGQTIPLFSISREW